MGSLHKNIQFPFNDGVPEGPILSPTLFALHIN